MANRHILITGAGGGLGRELARTYAEPGIKLTLWGRDEAKLQPVAEACTAKGATVELVREDARNLEACRNLLTSIDAQNPLDLAFLNAGVNSGTRPDGSMEPPQDACRTIAVNALGTINLAAVLIERMLDRNAGQVVMTCSLAALYPLPDFAAYSASKKAVSYYARSMRAYAAKSKVKISLIYPGYMDTDMARRLSGPQPQTWSAEKSAVYIRKRLDAGAKTVIYPHFVALGTFILNFLPPPFNDFFAKRFGFTVEPDAESKRFASADHNFGHESNLTSDKPSPDKGTSCGR